MTEKIPVCKKCGFEIPVGGKFAKNDRDGTILCEKCFNELVESGEIE